MPHFCGSGAIVHANGSCFEIGNNTPFGCENLPPAALLQCWTALPSMFSFAKENQKRTRS